MGTWLCPMCKTPTRRAHDGPRECLMHTMSDRGFQLRRYKLADEGRAFWMHMFDVAVGIKLSTFGFKEEPNPAGEGGTN
jgi:hypothetical protein